MLAYTYIHSFITAVNQDQALQFRQLACNCLRKTLSLRGKQYHALLCRHAFRKRCGAQALNTFKDRFRLEHHALAAAKWAVINGSVAIVRKRSQIANFNLHQPGLPGLTENAVL